MAKILVTGGAGFIGSHLVDKLIDDKYKVIVFDNLSSGNKKNINNKAKFYKVDINSLRARKIILREKPQVIFHLAAQINLRQSVKHPLEDIKTNVNGSLNILTSFIEANKNKLDKCKFIFSSTGGAIYGDTKIIPTPELYRAQPLSPYGINKLIIEYYLHYFYKVFGLKYIALRYSNVYGPRQNFKGEAGVVAIFINNFLNEKQPIIYGNGKQTRDFIYVDDVVKANLVALKNNKIGVYNIGTEKEISINTTFHLIQNELGIFKKPKYKPLPLGDLKRSCLNCSKAKKELGWQSCWELQRGIEETIKWFKNNN